MADYQRIIHQQALRKAEGYLELAMGWAQPLQLDHTLRTQLAQRALDQLARVDEGRRRQAAALYLVGQAYRVMEQHERAILPLAQAAQREPENIHIWLALAWCQKRIDRLDLAIESLENALAVQAEEPILHYNLACYWSLAGNSTMSLRYLAQSLQLDPSYRSLIADEPDFDPIRDLPEFQSIVDVIV